MQLSKRLLLLVKGVGRDHEEVAVACRVAAAEREGAREVDPDQARVQDPLQAADEVGKEVVQLRKLRGSQWTTMTFRMTMLSPRTRFRPTTTAVPVLLMRSSRA